MGKTNEYQEWSQEALEAANHLQTLKYNRDPSLELLMDIGAISLELLSREEI